MEEIDSIRQQEQAAIERALAESLAAVPVPFRTGGRAIGSAVEVDSDHSLERALAESLAIQQQGQSRLPHAAFTSSSFTFSAAAPAKEDPFELLAGRVNAIMQGKADEEAHNRERLALLQAFSDVMGVHCGDWGGIVASVIQDRIREVPLAQRADEETAEHWRSVLGAVIDPGLASFDSSRGSNGMGRSFGSSNESSFGLISCRQRVDREVDCPVCYDSAFESQLFLMPCRHHRTCHSCAQRLVYIALREKNVPQCGLPRVDGKACDAQFDVETMLYLKFEQEVERETAMSTLQEVLCSKGVASIANLFHCPTPGCKQAMQLNDPSIREVVHCSPYGCGYRYCSLCKLQYHYGVRQCVDVGAVAQRWMSWVNEGGRIAFAQRRLADTERYAKERQEFEQAQARNAERNRELAQRFEELRQDEEWKAANCRVCPHCGRAVEHQGGCSSMICGQDYHGGNDQNGCRQSFSWSEAAPYQPTAGSVRREELDIEIPEEQESVRHEHIVCDRCKMTPIIGLRFECIHCPSINLCQECEATVIDDELPAPFGGSRHDSANHVFRIWTQPQGY